MGRGGKTSQEGKESPARGRYAEHGTGVDRTRDEQQKKKKKKKGGYICSSPRKKGKNDGKGVVCISPAEGKNNPLQDQEKEGGQQGGVRRRNAPGGGEQGAPKGGRRCANGNNDQNNKENQKGRKVRWLKDLKKKSAGPQSQEMRRGQSNRGRGGRFDQNKNRRERAACGSVGNQEQRAQGGVQGGLKKRGDRKTGKTREKIGGTASEDRVWLTRTNGGGKGEDGPAWG